MEEGKKWWRSKTLWTNTVMMVAAVAAGFSNGTVSLSSEDTAVVIAVVNIVLRLLTKQGLSV